MAKKKSETDTPREPEPSVAVEPQPESEPEMQLVVLENTSVFRWNFEEIKARLQDGIVKYTGLVVTEENLPEMEKTAREIASLRVKVNRFRIDTKKQLAATADRFDAEARELGAIIDQAEAPLKEQLQKYEDERILHRETELLKFAWKTCVSIGVTDEFYQTLKLPGKLLQRSVSDKAAKEEVVSMVEQLYEQQKTELSRRAAEIKAAEEAERLNASKMALITALCRSQSEAAGLKTALTLDDIRREYPVIEICGLEQIPAFVDRAVARRMEIEQAAAVRPAPPPMPVPPPGLNMAPTTPRPAPPPQGPPLTATAKLWEVTLKFRCTPAQAARLKPIFADQGMEYEVINQTEVQP